MLRLFIYLVFVAGVTPSKLETISGIVIDSQTHRPVKDAYVYVVRGEEEGLTNDSGRFSFTVTATDDMKLKVQHPRYKTSQISVDKLAGNKISLVSSEK